MPDRVNRKHEAVNGRDWHLGNFAQNIFIMTFQHKKIVIAGGTSGIGLATALRFQKMGGAVTVTGRNMERLSAAEKIGLRTAAVDSRDRKALDRLFSEHGKVDHLVIAPGGNKGMGEFNQLSLEELKEAFAAKFWPQLETLQAALPFLAAGSSVTLITAISSMARLPGTAGLAAINGALELMVPILAKELKPVRINAVSPGLVDTSWWDFIPKENRQEAFAGFTANIPVGRVAQPEEIADVIVFLAGNEYMTGEVIGCDGGMA
jgi:NAD(P)-dependent dehydrogenase (short-subunit alcohol dehydrogenase family)